MWKGIQQGGKRVLGVVAGMQVRHPDPRANTVHRPAARAWLGGRCGAPLHALPAIEGVGGQRGACAQVKPPPRLKSAPQRQLDLLLQLPQKVLHPTLSRRSSRGLS